VFHNANIREKEEECLYFFADSLQNFTNSAFSEKPAFAAASPEHRRLHPYLAVAARIPPAKTVSTLEKTVLTLDFPEVLTEFSKVRTVFTAMRHPLCSKYDRPIILSCPIRPTAIAATH
jgi:hypothetical protein